MHSVHIPIGSTPRTCAQPQNYRMLQELQGTLIPHIQTCEVIVDAHCTNSNGLGTSETHTAIQIMMLQELRGILTPPVQTCEATVNANCTHLNAWVP